MFKYAAALAIVAGFASPVMADNYTLPPCAAFYASWSRNEVSEQDRTILALTIRQVMLKHNVIDNEASLAEMARLSRVLCSKQPDMAFTDILDVAAKLTGQ